MQKTDTIHLDERALRLAASARSTRDRVLACLDRAPGATRRAVASALGVSYHTADYHLDRLASERRVACFRYGGERHYFSAGAKLPGASRAEVAVMQRAGASRVLELVRERPHASRAELARELGVTVTTISWHRQRLREHGLLPSSPDPQTRAPDEGSPPRGTL